MAARVIVRIELTPSAKEHVSAISERTGMTQVAMLSRLVEWFANESELVQAAVLGHYPVELRSEVAKMILKQMAHEEKRGAKG